MQTLNENERLPISFGFDRNAMCNRKEIGAKNEVDDMKRNRIE